MKRNPLILMHEPDGSGGASGTPPSATPPATPPAPPAPPPPPAGSPPAPPVPPPPATPPPPPATPPGQPADSAEPASLLAGEVDTPPAVAPEAVTKLLDAIDLRFTPEGAAQPITLDKAYLQSVLPELLKIAPTATKEQVAALARAGAAHQFKQFQAAAAQDQAVMAGMVAKVKETFGADLPTVLSLAKRGGAAFFGQELWSELATVPAFSNDHRVIAALAQFGRSIAADRGPGGGSGAGAEKSFYERWTTPPG